MKIAIIGAGIGGLAAASLLHDAGHEIAIFDQFDAPRPLGSGLVIQPVGQAVLDRIGIGDAARALGTPITRLEGVDQGNGQTVLDVRYDRAGGGRFGLAIHRASLFHCVLNAAFSRSLSVATGARVVATPRDGAAGRRVETADGRSFGPFALVVDASGARSGLSPLRARPLSYGAIWGTVPWPDATALPRDRLTQRYFRASKMAGVLPVGRMPGDATERSAIFWSMPAAALDAWRATPLAAWKAEVTAFWPEFAPFLATVAAYEDMVPARYAHGTLRRPYGPGIVHIGDAAHSASPQLGQGANMALLDALALGVALSRVSDDPLRDYAAMRRWHIRLYQAMSWAFTPQYQSDSHVLPWLRNHVLMPVSRIPPVPRILTRLVGGDLVPPLAGQPFP
jgi:2-polyprenyl-6-methoxyphenol hydroxylase-like FAD-dependent oxidoreductase